MKIDPRALEAAILKRIPSLDRTGDGKVNVADLSDAVTDARAELEARAIANPTKALWWGIAGGLVIGAAIAVTVLKIAARFV